MKRNVQKLFPSPGATSGGAALAVVEAAEKGQARTLTLADGETVAAFAHLSEVPLLKAGDRVLVQLLAEGAVVVGKVRAPGEAPQPLVQNREGRIEIEAAGGICLQAGDARIELTPDGRIWVDGSEVCNVASGRMRLQGATIELN